MVYEFPFLGHRKTQIVKILKLRNNNVICVYLRKPARHFISLGLAGGSASYLN